MKIGLAFFILWIGASYWLSLNEVFLPEAFGVANSLLDEAQNGKLFSNLNSTISRVFFGILIGVVSGVFIGVALGSNKHLRDFFFPGIEFLRGIPTSMLFPIFIVFFGIGEVSKIVIVVTATFPILVVSTLVGLLPRSEVQDRMDYFQIHRQVISFKTIFLSMMWNALPSIISGIKVAISIALVLTIVTEMFFVASSGVGWAAYQAYQSFDLDKMYGYIMVVGTLGVVFNVLFDRVVSRLNTF